MTLLLLWGLSCFAAGGLAILAADEAAAVFRFIATELAASVEAAGAPSPTTGLVVLATAWILMWAGISLLHAGLRPPEGGSDP